MPFVTELDECDKTILSVLLIRYSHYLPAMGTINNSFCISLYNLHEAHILETYNQNQPATLKSILNSHRVVLQQDTINLLLLDPTNSLRKPLFEYIAKYRNPLEAVALLACLTQNNLLTNTAEVLALLHNLDFKSPSEYSKFIYALNTIAKANPYLLTSLARQKLEICKNTKEYADVIVDLHTQNDFNDQEMHDLLHFLINIEMPVEALKYIRKLKSLSLSHLFVLDHTYTVLNFHTLNSTIFFLEQNNTRPTEKIVKLMHLYENCFDLIHLLLYINMNFQNNNASSKEENLCAIHNLIKSPTFFPPGKNMLRIPGKNAGNAESRFYLSEDFYSAIMHLTTFTSASLLALKKLKPHNIELTVNLFCRFGQSNASLNQPSVLISLCEVVEIFYKYLDPALLQDRLTKALLDPTFDTLSLLAYTCRKAMSSPNHIHGELLTENFRRIVNISNQCFSPAIVVSENLNKRTLERDEKDANDSKSKVSNTPPNTAKKIKTALTQNSFLNTTNATTTSSNNSSIINFNSSQAPSQFLDYKTEFDIVMQNENIASATYSDPRTVKHINLDLARLLVNSWLKTLLCRDTSLSSLRNKALFNINDDKALETLIIAFKQIQGDSALPFFGDKVLQLLDERRTLTRDNTPVASGNNNTSR